MQETVELVKKYDSREISYNVLLGNLELLLEKEKEQIMIAFEVGDIQNHIQDAEEYYKQTYKEHKITINQTKRSIEGIGLNNQNK